MNLGEILQEIRYLTPNNGYSDEVLTQRVNLTIQKLFRMYPLPDKVERFLTIPGIGGPYALPDDCPPDRITSVVVNEYTLPLVDEGEPLLSGCYMIQVGGLFIFPEPDGEYDLWLYYKNRPAELSASKPSEVPDFPEDYHMMIVYDVAKWVASTMRDIDLVNNFQSEFQDIADQARRDFRKVRSHRVKIVQDWWR